MGDTPWRPTDAPRLDGRVAVVTGANSGIGFQTARLLAHLGARTVLACRSPERGGRALERLLAEVPGADAGLAPLDLADLASVRAFADKPPADRIDLLVNNAGVMALPYRTTADGFEMQFGTNHLGHFALTGLLLPRLLASGAPRVVTVSSELHRVGRPRFGGAHRPDGDGPDRYGRWSAYARSKLANLLFSAELHRRAEHAGAPLLSAAAHPGMAATDLAAVGPSLEGRAGLGALLARGAGTIGHSDLGGALASVRAAVDPGVRGGAYVGPRGFFGLRGGPRFCGRSTAARDSGAAADLWSRSEKLTGVSYTWV
ncbi:oxidoreductase [Nocardiopsis suaedae]|uniref:Oxidoreductase n=1 Tax=Nocardiopsis suaedae TaxID=3018444 RepID=A0ABT4TFI3_9ACTN|nr:oxidoreductase [Nocardiopsis suaedae]MDA2802887.1 oxidoreductase [Nocardiopsis suaedae]